MDSIRVSLYTFSKFSYPPISFNLFWGVSFLGIEHLIYYGVSVP